jgi:hypothetical protein
MNSRQSSLRLARHRERQRCGELLTRLFSQELTAQFAAIKPSYGQLLTGIRQYFPRVSAKSKMTRQTFSRMASGYGLAVQCMPPQILTCNESTDQEKNMDMEQDIFAEYPYGKVAIQKMAPVPENFRLYSAGWLGDNPKDRSVMEVNGAEFRVAKSGPNKGKLSIMIPGTKRTAYVTNAEMTAAA